MLLPWHMPWQVEDILVGMRKGTLFLWAEAAQSQAGFW